MDKSKLAVQSDHLKSELDKLDLLLDNMTVAQAQSLSKVYESINIILKAHQVMIKPGLRLVEE